MSFFKEISTPKESEHTERAKKNDLQKKEKLDISRENYDSTEAWMKAREVYVKNCEEIAKAYKKKADCEYAQYKNAERNGESNDEKKKHYDLSQELYAKVKCEMDRVRNANKDVYSCSEENYAFEDKFLESFFKSQKFQELRDIFQTDNWCKMDYSEKKQAIEELVDCLSKALNLPSSPKIYFYELEKCTFGIYNCNDNKITINTLYLNDPQKIIKVAAHEVWHAYQRMKADNPHTDKEYLYRINFAYYFEDTSKGKSAKSFAYYYKQLVEAEARAFANYFISKFGDDFK